MKLVYNQPRKEIRRRKLGLILPPHVYINWLTKGVRKYLLNIADRVAERVLRKMRRSQLSRARHYI